MSNKDNQLERFNYLFRSYAVAVELCMNLVDSGILQQKIKVNEQNVNDLVKKMVPAMANDLRQAELNSFISVHAGIIYQAYFDDLNLRGSEWEYADLYELFKSEQEQFKQDQLED